MSMRDEEASKSVPSVQPVPLLMFSCPNCGTVSQDDVIFLCNHCKQEELVVKDGVYMCPSCLIPGENFECMLCGSTEVTLPNKSGKKFVSSFKKAK